MAGPQTLSILVPCFNEAGNIAALIDRLERALAPLQGLAFEWIFVDDGSADGTLQALVDAATTRPHMRVLELSRNFGKEAALSAGLDVATGDAVVPLDADLQHPPELIPTLVARWREGHDVVLARRRSRKGRGSGGWQRLATGAFYRLHNLLSEHPVPADVGDFRLMDRSVVEALRRLPERRRFMKGLYAWVGFRQVLVDFDVQPRHAGRPAVVGRRRLSLALDGLTSFSTAPLRLATWLGAAVATVAVAHGAWIVGKTLWLGVELPGYASLMSAVLFLGGVQLLCLGLLGEYIGRIYGEAKQRPLYVVRRDHRPAADRSLPRA